ncbi:MAG: 2-oxoglutarate dehydrogenase complex dihydrolipoyllysine-residue succinyltransferase [Bauldia sp.]|nr:2-oxoglutarate dehydrogenase complex dihydrolipoyllysine-residue succinyltransferase [Bauldia sp.]
MTEIRVPALGESITEATIGRWHKKVGDAVAADEPLVELETDKVTVEVPSPAAGVIEAIAAKDGDTVGVGAVIGSVAARDGAGAKKAKAARKEAAPARASVATAALPGEAPEAEAQASSVAAARASPAQSPAVRRVVAESGIDPALVSGTGKDGRVTKGDVLAAVRESLTMPGIGPAPVREARAPAGPEDEGRERRVRMTRLRQTIARRLKDAQNTAAMLTTFNEVDMSAVSDLRKRYREPFEKAHGVKLGFMGFFVKAAVGALREFPAVNAEIDGTDIVFKDYFHIGVAVGTDRGLVVPVVRNADALSLAGIEKAIASLGAKARDGTLALDDLQGGTFTISNGGVFGSLMSTPILNAPQSGVLGMHKIQERPVVADGTIVIRPMMYLALTYDHRIVDGREAVSFLVRVKETLEDPARMVLGL